MNVNGIRAAGYLVGYETRRTERNTSEKRYFEKTNNIVPITTDTEKKASLMDIYHMMKRTKIGMEKGEEKEESKTDTDIIVKPDGSRVLVVTMKIGGMETTMSLEISKPTTMQNDDSGQHTDNGNMLVDETDMTFDEGEK